MLSVSILLLARVFCARSTTASIRVRANVHVRACSCNPRSVPIKCILYDIASDHNDGMQRAAPHSRIPHATTLALRVIARPEDAWEVACGKVRGEGFTNSLCPYVALAEGLLVLSFGGSAHAIDERSSQGASKTISECRPGKMEYEPSTAPKYIHLFS